MSSISCYVTASPADTEEIICEVGALTLITGCVVFSPDSREPFENSWYWHLKHTSSKREHVTSCRAAVRTDTCSLRRLDSWRKHIPVRKDRGEESSYEKGEIREDDERVIGKRRSGWQRKRDLTHGPVEFDKLSVCVRGWHVNWMQICVCGRTEETLVTTHITLSHRGHDKKTVWVLPWTCVVCLSCLCLRIVFAWNFFFFLCKCMCALCIYSSKAAWEFVSLQGDRIRPVECESVVNHQHFSLTPSSSKAPQMKKKKRGGTKKKRKKKVFWRINRGIR